MTSRKLIDILNIVFIRRKFWIVFLLSISIFIITLAPGVTGEDSGELTAAAYSWGVAHPSGYPLWTLLSGIFIRIIPVGTIAFKANLFSAVLAATSAVIFCKILIKFFNLPEIPAVLGSLCFSCGLHLWSQAVITEVYTLHILLTCIILYFLFAWQQKKKNRYLYLLALSFGLGLSNHHLTILFGPILALVVLVQKPKVFISPKVIMICLVLLLVGLLPYLYLPIAASNGAYINWGDINNWESFKSHVLRKQYDDESMKEVHTWQRFIFHLKKLSQWNASQYTLFSIPFVFTGLIFLALKKMYRNLFFSSMAIFIMYTVILAELLNFSAERQELFCARVFFLSAYIILGLWLVFGVHSSVSLFLKHPSTSKTISTSIVLCTLFIIILLNNFPKNNMRQYFYAEDHAVNILNSLEENAIILPSGDHNTFPLIYKHHVEKLRPDITIADKYGYIEYDLYKDMPNAPVKIRTFQEREAIELHLVENSGKPVYFTIQPSLARFPEYNVFPHGMLFRVYKIEEGPPDLQIPQYTYKNLETYPTVMDHAASVILSDYHFYLASNALRKQDLDVAFKQIEKTAELSKGLKEEMNNLGTLLAEHGLDEQAIGFYEKAAKLDIDYLTPRWNLAYLFKAKNDTLHAIQVFNDLSRLTPEDFRVFGELGFLLYQYGEVELAIKNWGQSLSLNPDQPQIIQAMGDLYNTQTPEIN